MPLISGARLGPYEILSVLGAGGMGEVYLARDTRLGREVALKVVPEALARQPGSMARFEREAQLLASLNHPNIAAVYGLEDSSGVRALVMELVAGPTLADRIAAGPVPLDETLIIAKQIAEALEYAHDHAIIHRDLKPANIKLTPAGNVKVLDFGLAKALQGDPRESNISNSPTLSIAATQAGIILGTAAYMSPEQAKGKPVDRRTDIWSFGCVLFEMLSAQPPFAGETTTDILAAVVRGDPDWNALPSQTPAPVRDLVERCLRKDIKARLQSIGDARIAIEEYLAHPEAPSSSTGIPVVTPAPLWKRTLPWLFSATLALAILLLLWRPWRAPQPAPAILSLSADSGAAGNLYTDYGPAAVFSPDGSRMVYVVENATHQRQLFLRSLDQLQALPLAGTEGARDPFFSPDGQWIGFFAAYKLKKISAQGGAAVVLCDVVDPRGGTWSEDGTIIFAANVHSGLMRISSNGGSPVPFSTRDMARGEASHRWPHFLPGGKAVLFSTSINPTNYEDSDLTVQVVATGEKKILFHGGYAAIYVPGGALAFVHQGALFAAAFDLKRLELAGQPVPLLEGVRSNHGNAGAQISVANNGMFAYLAGHDSGELFVIDWLTNDGKLAPLRKQPENSWSMALSPDGNLLASTKEQGSRHDIWVDDWRRDTSTRLTFEGEFNNNPAWTPDGKRISYTNGEGGGVFNISWRRADGAGAVQSLLKGKRPFGPMSWAPNGHVLAFAQNRDGDNWNVMTVSVEGDEKSGWRVGEAKPFLATAYSQDWPAFSPDGRWLAYAANDSGAYEVYVRPFPGPGGRWQISNGGGVFPQWSAKGHELFYRTNANNAAYGNQLMAVNYSASGDSFRAEKPRLWSNAQLGDRGIFTNVAFALHPDGKRVAIYRRPEADSPQQFNRVNFILNFPEEVWRKLGNK